MIATLSKVEKTSVQEPTMPKYLSIGTKVWIKNPSKGQPSEGWVHSKTPTGYLRITIKGGKQILRKPKNVSEIVIKYIEV